MTTVLPSEASLDAIAERCKARGATLTPIRRDMLALLQANPEGIKAYDLLSRIRAIRQNATPPTVYRALDFLIEQGLAHKIERLNLFMACQHESHCLPSLFVICPRCSRVSELVNPALTQSLFDSLQQAGHHLAAPEVEVSAVCPACQDKVALS